MTNKNKTNYERRKRAYHSLLRALDIITLSNDPDAAERFDDMPDDLVARAFDVVLMVADKVPKTAIGMSLYTYNDDAEAIEQLAAEIKAARGMK